MLKTLSRSLACLLVSSLMVDPVMASMGDVGAQNPPLRSMFNSQALAPRPEVPYSTALIGPMRLIRDASDLTVKVFGYHTTYREISIPDLVKLIFSDRIGRHNGRYYFKPFVAPSFSYQIESAHIPPRPADPAENSVPRGPLALTTNIKPGRDFQRGWPAYVHAVQNQRDQNLVDASKWRLISLLLRAATLEMWYFEPAFDEIADILTEKGVYLAGANTVHRKFEIIHAYSPSILAESLDRFIVGHDEFFIFSPSRWARIKRWVRLEFRPDTSRYPEDWKWIDARDRKAKKAIQQIKGEVHKWFRVGLADFEAQLVQFAVGNSGDGVPDREAMKQLLKASFRMAHYRHNVISLFGVKPSESARPSEPHGPAAAA